ncbi:YbaB/EbfC family nucleoid-associated protein [Oryzobacter sp. R7]|uniref:YbaB/EbfC family nucleoid-associated protein n=1 Tax=Oryzobacter faecalis TaxID=3388656 RepID=UPI00398D3A5E
MSDPMERMLDVRDEIDRTAQRFERAAAARTRVEGTDTAGVVSVTVDADGALASVRIRADWESRLSVDELGPSVVAAVTDAGARSAVAWGTALSDELDGPRPMTRPLPSTHGSLAAGLDEVTSTRALVEGDRASLEAMVEVLQRMLVEIDDVSDEVRATAARTVTGRAPGADVTVTLTGAAAVTAVTFGPGAARHHAANLSRHVMTAYEDAVRQVATGGVEQVLERSVFGELRRLADDPSAVADRFRAL